MWCGGSVRPGRPVPYQMANPPPPPPTLALHPPSSLHRYVKGSYNAEDKSYTAEPCRKTVTIKMLLTHTSGLSYGFDMAGVVNKVDKIYVRRSNVHRSALARSLARAHTHSYIHTYIHTHTHTLLAYSLTLARPSSSSLILLLPPRCSTTRCSAEISPRGKEKRRRNQRGKEKGQRGRAVRAKGGGTAVLVLLTWPHSATRWRRCRFSSNRARAGIMDSM